MATTVITYIKQAKLGLLVAMLGAGSLTGCDKFNQQEEVAATPQPPKVVSYLTLTAAGTATANNQTQQDKTAKAAQQASATMQAGTQTQPVRMLSGQVVAAESTNLSFQAEGQIKKIYAKLGDRVKKGQLLAELDTTSYELQLNQSQAQLVQATKERDKAKIDVDRRQNLVEMGAVSKAEVDSVVLAYNSAQESVKIAQNSVALSKKQFNDTKLVAPFTGVITQQLAEVGQVASASVPVFTLATDNSQEVHLTVPENLLSSIRLGQVLPVSFPAVANAQKRQGKVTEISSQASQGSFPVTLLLNGVSQQVRSGMTAEVALPVALQPMAKVATPTKVDATDKAVTVSGNTFAIPPSAVSASSNPEDAQGGYVFRLQQVQASDTTATLEKVEVVIAGMSGENLLVTGGLQAGDKIVRTGVSLLDDKQAVELMGTGTRRVNP